MSHSLKMDLDDLEIFCTTATCNSFTEASILLGTTPSSISKAIARLEKKLSLKLFIRSTRAMRLTEEGLSYYDVCKNALHQIYDIENQLTKNIIPRGTLRISMPDAYGNAIIIPYLKPFFEQYKESLQFEISLGNNFVNFTKESIDLAIRIGDLQDARIIAKHIHDTHYKLVASPDYLAKYGTPETLEALQTHQCIGLKFPDHGVVMPWEFGARQEILPINYAIIHSHAKGALNHAIKGYGIAYLLDFTAKRALDTGDLVEILPGNHPPPMSVHLVYPSNRYIPAKTRLFMEYFFKEVLPKIS